MLAKHQQTAGSLAKHLSEVNQLFDRRGFVVFLTTGCSFNKMDFCLDLGGKVKFLPGFDGESFCPKLN